MQFPTLSLAMVALLFSGAEAATLKNRGKESCMDSCLPAEPPCSKIFTPTKIGECWTCCSDTGGDRTLQERQGPVPIVNSDQIDELIGLLGLEAVQKIVDTDQVDELINTLVGDDDGQSAPPVVDTNALDELIRILGLAAVGEVVNVDNIPELINSIIGDAD